MNREEFEIIKGFGQRKWDYDKMENYLKENKFFRGIWADEIGLHPEDDFDRLIFNPYYMQLFQHGYAAGKTEQQEKIDEMSEVIEAFKEALTDTENENDELKATLEKTVDEMKAHHLKVVDAMADKIDELIAKNPDVPCPACDGRGEIIVSGDTYFSESDKLSALCKYCLGDDLVPLTKAQEYKINKMLEALKAV